MRTGDNDIMNMSQTQTKSRNENLGKSKTIQQPTTGETRNPLAMYMAKGNFQSLRELKEKAQTNRYKVQ